MYVCIYIYIHSGRRSNLRFTSLPVYAPPKKNLPVVSIIYTCDVIYHSKRCKKLILTNHKWHWLRWNKYRNLKLTRLIGITLYTWIRYLTLPVTRFSPSDRELEVTYHVITTIFGSVQIRPKKSELKSHDILSPYD